MGDTLSDRKVFEDAFREATNMGPAMERRKKAMAPTPEPKEEDKGYALKPGEILDPSKLK